MYGITFDLNTRDLQMFYSHTEQQAYAEIAEILQNYGFKNMGKVFYFAIRQCGGFVYGGFGIATRIVVQLIGSQYPFI